MATDTPRMIKPYKGASLLHVSQGFSVDHPAIDIVYKYGTPLVAPENCRVLRIYGDGRIADDTSELAFGYGCRLLGLDSGLEYLYWHTWSYLPIWSGDIVSAGQIIAFMGNSGRVFTGGVYVPLGDRNAPPYKGTHLHLAVYLTGSVPIDPLPFIQWYNEPTYSVADYLKAVGNTLTKITKLAFR